MDRQESFLRCLPQKVVGFLKENNIYMDDITEIRLRRGKPLGIGFGKKLFSRKELVISDTDMEEAWRLITASSVYALEEELKRGYITLAGGHRVGIAGSAVLREDKVRTQKDIGSLNYRFSKEVKGAGESLLPVVFDDDSILNVLVFSPPCAGKTTLLRELTRLLSDGSNIIPPQNISLVDERGEIAASYMGLPSYDVGENTDVLHGFPKSEGMMLALRSLAPQIIVTDEIGREEDQFAVAEAIRCGVSVLLSAHGGSLEELQTRPVLKDLLADGVFHRLILLGQTPRPGTVENVYKRIRKEGRFDYVEMDSVSQSCGHYGVLRHPSRQ